MACKNVCKLCDKLVISSAVTFTNGNLVINLPAGNYGDGCKYCIVVAQTIPETTTINAPVYITIGTGTTLYPLNKCKGFDYEVDEDTVRYIRMICKIILEGYMDRITLFEPNGDQIKLTRNGNAVKVQRTSKKQICL